MHASRASRPTAVALGARRGSVDRAKASSRAGQLRSSESLIMGPILALRDHLWRPPVAVARYLKSMMRGPGPPYEVVRLPLPADASRWPARLPCPHGCTHTAR